MRIETFENMKVKSGGRLIEAAQTRSGVMLFVARAITKSFIERSQKPPAGLEKMLKSARDGDLPEESVVAHVSHGRWCVNCPDCSHASMYSDTIPVYICPIHQIWRAVVLPVYRVELETELSLRPVDDPAAGNTKANWKPGETIDDIRAENAMYFYGRQDAEMNERYSVEFEEIEAVLAAAREVPSDPA